MKRYCVANAPKWRNDQPADLFLADDILPALLKRMLPHNAFDAAMALGFTEEEFATAAEEYRKRTR